jgi:hypothetical protein
MAGNMANFIAVANCLLGCFPEGEPHQNQSDCSSEE